MTDIKINPSLMCADQLRLYEETEKLLSAGADMIHIDVMDGVFVPNIQIGTETVKAVRAGFDVPLDFHLMTEAPHDKLGMFPIRAGDWVSVHYETTPHPARAAEKIRSDGAKALLALDPATPLCVIEDVISCFDGILIMTVNPGYSGQKLIPETIDKIRRAKRLLPDGYIIEADGNVSFENAALMKDAGANALVCGSSSLFSGRYDYKTAIKELKKI
ncbi:MAG: ribulose-phosphate 3-epimerase [Clostridia bacterium]|nr:ribulose-phosphate 3-epimerase [Clostridia bacterium]